MPLYLLLKAQVPSPRVGEKRYEEAVMMPSVHEGTRHGLRSEWRRRVTVGFLLGTALLGMVLYLSGLTATLSLGSSTVHGFLLIPALSTPMYMAMLLVALAGVGLTLLASTLQRRRRRPPEEPDRVEGPKPYWQSLLTMLMTLALLGLSLIWLIKHGPQLQALFESLRTEIAALQESLGAGRTSFVEQVDSPAAGYVLFGIVLVIYGGMALLALWVLYEDRGSAQAGLSAANPQVRRVYRAMTAGLRELREHADPRQAIIACYARLEHLLEDHGVPAYDHLTPQEYMGAVLRDLDLPADAIAGLIRLFELARYSLHPLDDGARMTAIAHLERLKVYLEGEEGDARHP
jgi:hypothetical protein